MKPNIVCSEYLPVDSIRDEVLKEITREASNHKNVLESSRILLNLLKQLVESISSKPERDAIHFSGQNSGIIIFNIEKFPIFNFSIIIEVEFENLINARRKSNIFEIFKKNKENQQKSLISNRLTGNSPPQKGNDDLIIENPTPDPLSDYQPRLLSLKSKKGAILDIYLDVNAERSRRIVIEVGKL